jgi:hypothetical protein
VASAAGLTTNVIGTGTSGGVTYIDLQITGTTTGTSYVLVPEAATQIAALNGQAWASSAWWSVVAGNLTNVTAYFFDIRELDSGGVQLTSGAISVSAPTSTFTRIAASRTTSNASTAFVQPRFRFTVTNSAAVDFTLRIGLPQLELGAFATSVIPTTTTALTRNADVASMTGTDFSSWYNQTEGTLYAEGFVYTAPANTVNPCLFSIDDNTGSNRIQLYRGNNNGSPNAGLAVVNGGSIQSLITAGNTQFQNGKIAGAYKVDNFAASLNGAAAVTDTTGTIPTVTQMQIGTGPALANVNGTIRRIAYYPTRLANEQLQALTG